MKPERVNGQVVAAPYTRGADGIMSKLEGRGVMRMPAVSVVYPLPVLVENETRAIQGLKALTTSELRARLFAFATAAIENDRRARR